MSDAALTKAEGDADYWYEVAQTFCLLIANSHLPFEAVVQLVENVEAQATRGFPVLIAMSARNAPEGEARRSSLQSVVCLELFNGLRTIREEWVNAV